MMNRFKLGDVIFADDGEPIKIVKYIASGGEGSVYEVEYKGEKKAFKYFTRVGKWHEKIYDNLKSNIDIENIDDVFIWPEAITKKPSDFEDSGNNCFGYVMRLIPREFVSLSNCLVNRGLFFTIKKRLEVCLSIINAFEALRLLGLRTNYFDDGSIFINIESSEILIFEPEKISANRQNLRIAYAPRYIAPEMITDDAKSSVYTTRYSVAVILFMLIFETHPLEGKKWLIPCLTYKDAQNLYGYNPVFIADPKDDSNKPDEDIHREFILMWKKIPEYFKKFFIDVFNSERLHNPRKRLPLKTYRTIFEKYLNDIDNCNCKTLFYRNLEC